MNVLVVGGTGYIGRPIVQALASLGYNVYCISRSVSDELANNVTYLKFDWKTINWPVLVSDLGIDSIICLVSTSHPRSSNQDILKDTQDNLLPLIRMLEMIRNIRLNAFVYASSYGALGAAPFLVNKFSNSYQCVKASCEHYLSMYAFLSGVRTESIRISNPFYCSGFRRKGFGVIETFARKAVSGEKAEFFDDSESEKDYVHLDDVISELVTVLHGDSEPNFSIKNACSGYTISAKDIWRFYLSVSNGSPNYELGTLSEEARSGITKRYMLSKVEEIYYHYYSIRELASK